MFSSNMHRMASQVVLIGTGSEVDIAFQAAKELVAEGIGVRVVSLPSWELFQAQDESYRSLCSTGRTAQGLD